jgi:hypothetical protein
MFTKNLLPLTLGITLTAIPLAPSHALEVKTPNLYQLQGQGVKITYSTTSFDGKPRLDYQDKQQKLKFVGDQIRTTSLEIGTLITVTTRMTVDTGSTSFSVLIPAVNLGQNQSTQVVTNGITTVNRFSINPALLQGQTQTYTVIRLQGTAQSVQF